MKLVIYKYFKLLQHQKCIIVKVFIVEITTPVESFDKQGFIVFKERFMIGLYLGLYLGFREGLKWFQSFQENGSVHAISSTVNMLILGRGEEEAQPSQW